MQVETRQLKSSQIEFESIYCPLCGAAEYEFFLTAPDRFDLAGGDKYQLVSCAECKFVYLNPRPLAELITKFYNDAEYQPFLSTQKRLPLWDKLYVLVRKFTVRYKRLKIEKHIPKGKILDIG